MRGLRGAQWTRHRRGPERPFDWVDEARLLSESTEPMAELIVAQSTGEGGREPRGSGERASEVGAGRRRALQEQDRTRSNEQSDLCVYSSINTDVRSLGMVYLGHFG